MTGAFGYVLRGWEAMFAQEADEPKEFTCLKTPQDIDEEWALKVTRVIDPTPVYVPRCAAPELLASGFAQPCFQKCALVGSSGVLRNSSWGLKIDSHDAVIRMNNAPVVGFEGDVGSRTTLRFLHDYHLSSSNIGKLADTESEGMIVIWPPRQKPSDVRTGGPQPRFEEVQAFLKDFFNRKRRACAPVMRLSPEGFGEVYRVASLLVGKFPPVVPSTGFLGILTALQLCNKVNVYGLSWSIAKTSIRRHRRNGDDSHSTYYFNKKNALVSKKQVDTETDEELYYREVGSYGFTHHNLVAEKLAFRKIADMYNLAFF